MADCMWNVEVRLTPAGRVELPSAEAGQHGWSRFRDMINLRCPLDAQIERSRKQ